MSDTVSFPSTAFFEQLGERMHADGAGFRRLGPIDCTMVVKVALDAGRTALYELVFEGFGVKSIRPLGRIEEARASHFVIEGPLEAWREMIENIRGRSAADLEHTLNYLTLPDVPMCVSGPDQLEVDAFYRYNETLQRFFDGAALVDTSFAISAAEQPAQRTASARG